MTFEILCADSLFRFQGFTDKLFWSTWNWKINPWEVSSPMQLSDKSIVTCVNCKQTSEISYEILSVKSVEKTGFFEHRVLKMKNGGTLWELVRVAKGCCYLRFSVNSDWNRIELLKDITNTNGTTAFEYLTRMMPGILLKQNILSFHGVLMEYQGYGIVISAASGTGKTTHARLWRDLKHALIINGDYTAVRVKNGIWIGYGLPWSGTSGEQINRSVPLKALVVLERSEQNEAHRITGLDAFSSVLPHLQYPTWDKQMINKAMDNLDQFLKEVLIIRLCCRSDFESVDVLYQMLENYNLQ